MQWKKLPIREASMCGRTCRNIDFKLQGSNSRLKLSQGESEMDGYYIEYSTSNDKRTRQNITTACDADEERT